MRPIDYKNGSLLRVFLHYFKPHKKLFALDISCAVMVSAIDLAFPLVTRAALYELLPGKEYGTFFTVMGIMVVAGVAICVLSTWWVVGRLVSLSKDELYY